MVALWRGFVVWVERRAGASVLACYPEGKRPDGLGPAVDGVGFQASRPAEGLAQVTDPQRLEQEARLAEGRATDLGRRLESVRKDLDEPWGGRAEAERLLGEYDRACAGREEQGEQPALEPLRDRVTYRFRW